MGVRNVLQQKSVRIPFTCYVVAKSSFKDDDWYPVLESSFSPSSQFRVENDIFLSTKCRTFYVAAKCRFKDD